MGLPNLDGERRDQAERRLRNETVVWLTTVNAKGQPQTSPVGFMWDGDRLLIISQPASPKVRNLQDNPRASLHLDTDHEAADGGVLTIESMAEFEAGPLSGDEAAAYADRYRDEMVSAGMTAEQVFADFATVIRLTPTRVRSY